MRPQKLEETPNVIAEHERKTMIIEFQGKCRGGLFNCDARAEDRGSWQRCRHRQLVCNGDVMMPAAKRKIPTILERFTALLEEANADDLRDMIEAINTKTDEALDKLAEELRPKGEGGAVPVDWMRQNRSYVAATKENR